MNQLKFLALLAVVVVFVLFLHFPILLLLNRPPNDSKPQLGAPRGPLRAQKTVRYESKTVRDDDLGALSQKFPLSFGHEKEPNEFRRTTKIHITVKDGHVETKETNGALEAKEDEGKPDLARIRRHVNTTLVTALLDIGRGDWEIYQRPLRKYHAFMKNVLSLKVPMVIFVDAKSFAFVKRMRALLGLKEITKVWRIEMSDLPLFQYHHYAKQIIDQEKYGSAWRETWDPKMKFHPEATSAEYNLVVNSKPYFLYNTTVENPFGTNFFAWLDAGYGHGDVSVFPPHFYWFPSFVPSKISLIKLTPRNNPISKYSLSLLYRVNISVVSGGFLGGDAEAIGNFYVLFQRKIVELIARNYLGTCVLSPWTYDRNV
ncbi:hypothetical protein QR680_004968 [Steinernema hermaphroditum]|uniref:Uncharacterized protein n=1 Tax=Steinernema hermaphroditum TaxID=289476 RepID=A0AA39LUV2_9BILA|nr:hypothetical protein QR680_004968 [Steinernema hermaphroditum]